MFLIFTYTPWGKKMSEIKKATQFYRLIFQSFKNSPQRFHVRCHSNVAKFTDVAASQPFKTMQEVKLKLMDIMGVEKGYTTIPKSRDYLQKYLPKSQAELPVRKMSDSFDVAIVPLSTDVDLQDKYLSFLGHIRWGRLMEDMDMFAVWCVMKHIKNENLPANTPTPYIIVTLLVDEINFTDYLPKTTADIRLSGHVCWIGKSSIEVVVWLEQENHGSWQKITRALFLMAARNATNTGPASVNPLEPETEEEKEMILGGEARKKLRQQVLSKSLFKTIPDEMEQRLIHELFLKTVDEKDLILNRRVLPPHCKWMTDTLLSNIIFCHPEDRNLHNKVFGGFLMRHALELSWSAGFMHSKHRPRLLHISDIGFHRPVDVGSMLKMNSYVTYTQQQYMQIIVYAEVLDHRTGLTNTTNMFHYTYESTEPVVEIMPKSYHEAMMYIDGRRHFQHVMGVNRHNT